MASRPAWLPTAQPAPGGAAPAQAQQRHVFLPEGAGGPAGQQWGAKPSPYQQWRKPAQQVPPEAPAAAEQPPHEGPRPDGEPAARPSGSHWEAGPAQQHAWQPHAVAEPPAVSQAASQPASPLHHNHAPAGRGDPPPGTPNGTASPTHLDAAVRLRSIHEEITALKV